jgi:hypothetical protein
MRDKRGEKKIYIYIYISTTFIYKFAFWDSCTVIIIKTEINSGKQQLLSVYRTCQCGRENGLERTVYFMSSEFWFAII